MLPYTDELPYCPYHRPCMENPYLIIANKFIVHNCERQSNHYCPYYPGRRKLNMSTPTDNGHLLYDENDTDIDDTTIKYVCEDGLGICRKCGAAEIQLEEPCTGYPIVVANVRDKANTRSKYPNAHYEYIGRGNGSILGNPFLMNPEARLHTAEGEAERTRVIEEFKILLNQDRLNFEAAGKAIIDNFRRSLLTDISDDYPTSILPDSPLWKRVLFLANMNLERVVVLECFCAPKACHGDVIANAMKWIAKNAQKEEHNNA